jgi:peptidoglycan/LPS O-acetylase OafA/YrhL
MTVAAVLLLHMLIAAAALIRAETAAEEAIDFGTWNLAWLTLPIIFLASRRKHRRWALIGAAAGAPHFVVGGVGLVRVEVVFDGPDPLAGLGLVWAALLTVVFVAVSRAGAASRQGTG